MRSARAVSSAGASESVASVRAEVHPIPSASSAKPREAGRREYCLPQARDSVRPAPGRFQGFGPRLQGRSLATGVRTPLCGRRQCRPLRVKTEARRGCRLAQIRESIRPAPQRFRAPGARLPGLLVTRVGSASNASCSTDTWSSACSVGPLPSDTARVSISSPNTPKPR